MRQDDYAKYAVFADSLEKSFGKKEDKVVAVKGVSLRVEKGELYGIIGPDGAGKTTLFRILATLMLPDSGTAYVDGFDISGDYRLIRDRLGYMPGKFSLYPDLTVKENLEFFASVFGTTIKENYHLIKDIYERLEPFEKRKASKLSRVITARLPSRRKYLLPLFSSRMPTVRLKIIVTSSQRHTPTTPVWLLQPT